MVRLPQVMRSHHTCSNIIMYRLLWPEYTPLNLDFCVINGTRFSGVLKVQSIGDLDSFLQTSKIESWHPIKSECNKNLGSWDIIAFNLFHHHTHNLCTDTCNFKWWNAYQHNISSSEGSNIRVEHASVALGKFEIAVPK